MPRASSRFIERLKWIFSFPAMLGVFLVGIVFTKGREFFVDPDLWWHIKVGQDILRTHHWPTTDAYSFTAANTPWIAYEWLGELVIGNVAKLGGNLALDAFLIALGSAIMLGLYYLGTLCSDNCKAGFIPAAALCSIAYQFFTLRPQMLAFLYVVLLLIALELFRKGISWPLWSVPILLLAWVNTHGSFIVGLGVIVVYIASGWRSFQLGSVEAVAWSAGQRVKLELVLLLSLAVLPITPYGTQLAVYPFDLMFNQPTITANILEWRPLLFSEADGKIFLAVIVLLVLVQLLLRVSWRLDQLVLLFGAAAMACLHGRMLMFFVPFAVPILAVVFARWMPPYEKSKDQHLLNAGLMVCVAAAMIHYAPQREVLQKKVEKTFPVAAVQFLDSRAIPGPMLNTYSFGGYLLGAGRKTFIDGRGDIFERSGVMADYVGLVQVKPGAFSLLDHYRIASCLLKPDEALSTVLNSSPNWKQVYADNTSVLFVRIAPGISATEK